MHPRSWPLHAAWENVEMKLIKKKWQSCLKKECMRLRERKNKDRRQWNAEENEGGKEMKD